MGYKILALLFLAALSSSNAFNTLIPSGKELVYHYNGLILAGTHIPKSYASAFVLDGKFHMQTDKNSTFMWFTDLKYKMKNGEYDVWHDFESTEIPLPKEMEGLYKTFKVTYNSANEVMGLVTNSDEHHYITNIKKAIGSIMQMDTKKVHLEMKKPQAFHTDEYTIFGKGKTYYNVMPEEDHMIVQKMQEPSSTHHLYTHMITDMDARKCHAKFDEPLSYDSQKTYRIIKKDNMDIIDHIDTSGGTYYQPFQGKSIGQYIYMNQTFCFMEMVASTPHEVESEKLHHGFTYYMADMSKTTGPFPDLTHGRRSLSYIDKMVPVVEKMIHKVIGYFDLNHINTKTAEIKDSHIINTMKRHMLYFELKHFEKLHESLSQKTEGDKLHLHVYYHMIALVGTQPAYLHIKKLVLEKKMKDHMAVEVLQTMPFYVQYPTKQLMEEMAEMLTWKDKVSHSVFNAAVLSFANMVHEGVQRYNQYKHKNMWYGFEHEHDFIDEVDEEEKYFVGEKYYEKYLVEFASKLKEAKDFDSRVLYMQAMSNTRMRSIIHHIMPAIKGEWWDDDYLKVLAAAAAAPSIRYNEDISYEVYWPIMSNKKLPTAHRALALYMLMASQPSLQRLINVHWHMMYETNYALYQFYYKYLVAMSKTTDPCEEHFKTNVNQVLRYMMKPEFYGMTGYYQIDYTDKEGFGQILNWFFVHSRTDDEELFQISLYNQFDNLKFVPFSLLVRVKGLEGSIFNELKIDVTSPTHMFTYDNVHKLYSNILKNKHLTLNMILYKNHQVINIFNYDHTNMNKLFDMFKKGDEFNYVKKFIHIGYTASTTIMVPTEMGFPATLQYHLPKAHYFDLDMTMETVNKICTLHIDNTWKYWFHGKVGLVFYNPVVDVWQGVSRFNSFDAVIPLYMDLSFNPKEHTMKLSWKRHTEMEENVVGFRAHATSAVFVVDDMNHGVLKKSDPESHIAEVVTYGDEFKHEHIFTEKHCSNTGYHFTWSLFDSERYGYNMTVPRFALWTKMHSNKNSLTAFGNLLLTQMHYIMYSHVQTDPRTNGILLRLEPSKLYPVTNIDMTLKATSEYKNQDMFLLPASKHNVRATYSVKNSEKTVKTWDANLMLENNLGHTTSNMKMQITRMIPGQKDYKLCTDCSTKYLMDKMESHFTVGNTQTSDAKCTKDDQILEIDLVAEKSEEQLMKKHMYHDCMNRVWSDIHEQQTMDCYASYNSLRKNTYDIKMTHMPKEYKKMMWNWFDWIRSIYMPYYHHEDETTLKLEEDTMKIVMEYPMDAPVVDVHVYTPTHLYEFNGIPTEKWLHSMLHQHPYNTQCNRMFRFMHAFGLTKTCYIDHDSFENYRLMTIPFHLPTEWTMYIGDAATDSKHGVWGKKIEGTDKMAMKILHESHSLEIVPVDNKYDFIVDGKKLTDNLHHHSEDWFHYDWHQDTDVVVMMSHHFGFFMLYDGHHILVEVPNANVQYFGHCFDDSH